MNVRGSAHERRAARRRAGAAELSDRATFLPHSVTTMACMNRFALALLIVAGSHTAAQTVEVPPTSPLAHTIRALVQDKPADVRDAYAQSGYQALWTREGKPTAQAVSVTELLATASTRGLDPRAYGAADLVLRQTTLSSASARAAFDVDLTVALLRYVNDVCGGRVAPDALDFAFDETPKPFYFPSLAAAAATSDAPAALIGGVEPQTDEYRGLIAALAQYRTLAAEAPQVPALPHVARVAPGEHYEGIRELSALLRRLGDLSADAAVGDVYDGAIVDAVRSFQARHALEPDGVLGRATIAELNVPLTQRIAQIEWALERWRWAPRTSDDVIVINVPSFQLVARGADGSSVTMRVVVGKSAGHRTPLFDGKLRNVVFRPYWNVTPNIQRNEIVPKLERDRTYLARNGYEIVDGTRAIGTEVTDERLARLRTGALRVRQKPGQRNALGLVKFLFPNGDNIYLHSTPQPELFARARRDFSHGCIRVEDPAGLAAWVLRDQQWSPADAEAAMNGTRDDMYMKVTRPVRVVLMYATAAAHASGRVEFFNDIYRHDAQLAALLTPKDDASLALVASR